MTLLSLVTHLANFAGVRYDDNNVVIMRRIIPMVDEQHGGGMPPGIVIRGSLWACSTRSCPDMAVHSRHSRMRWRGRVNNMRMTRPRRSGVGGADRILPIPPQFVELESDDGLFLYLQLLMQLLCNHYTSMNRGKSTGVISLDTDPSGLIDDVLTKVKHVCDANVGVVPEVVIRLDNDANEVGRRGGAVVIPKRIDYMPPE